MLRFLRLDPGKLHMMRRFCFVTTIASVLVTAGASHITSNMKMGKQPDGSYIVSTEQRVEPGAIPFPGRAVDMALSQDESTLAVLCHRRILFITGRQTSSFPLEGAAGFRGILWASDGNHLFASTSAGYVQELVREHGTWRSGRRLTVTPPGAGGNPRPGGMVMDEAGTRLFVAALERNSIAEIDLSSGRWVREFHVQNLPFEVKLSPDESELIVSNWGGREVKDGDDTGKTGSAVVVVDPRGATSTGVVTFVNRRTGSQAQVPVGLHPTAIELEGDRVYVANAASDTLSEISIPRHSLLRTIPLQWGNNRLLGSMPCDMWIRDHIAYICNGGDNAICVMDLKRGKVLGFRPAGYYPIAIAMNSLGTKAFVLNTKGNGSVLRTARGLPGNVHDFQGTVSVIDINSDLAVATARVAADAGWIRDRESLKPPIDVYHGKIRHVLYVIKENRTYDEILGDMPEGDGDAKLCDLGETVTPNHHTLARQFALMDNAYVTGTNSADGHQWCTQALANDYLEHFYTGYRTYPYSGDCAMAVSTSGCLWDAAKKKGVSVRDYGEFCDGALARFSPPASSWKELWNDRISGRNRFISHAVTRLDSLRPYVNPNLCSWPLIMSDQKRADIFIEEYNRFSRHKSVPGLMILTLPCDHTEGRNPGFPKPKSMVADNDLALGRVIEAVSNSPEWKSTCVFVIEDDAQFGPDHVDGHRTVCYAISPYTRRHFVDHELCTTLSVLHSIELMLGIDPMTRFDALTPPLAQCFTNTPDLTPYHAVPNRVALDDMNSPVDRLTGRERRLTERSIALDWSGPDKADSRALNEILWSSLHGPDTAYPQYSSLH